jgi:1,6-anhydro-N-acetylmuramate kinase
MTMTLYLLAVFSIVLGILVAELLVRGWATDNVLTRARDTLEERLWIRRVRAINAARIAAGTVEAAE